jgi:hypothetical protein
MQQNPELTPVAAARTLKELLDMLREIGELVSPHTEYVTLVVQQKGLPDVVIPVSCHAPGSSQSQPAHAA